MNREEILKRCKTELGQVSGDTYIHWLDRVGVAGTLDLAERDRNEAATWVLERTLMELRVLSDQELGRSRAATRRLPNEVHCQEGPYNGLYGLLRCFLGGVSTHD